MIIVTGGTGFVGKNLQEAMPEAVYDFMFDLCKEEHVKAMFKHDPRRIIHLAAKVGGIKDNIAHPVAFLEDNLLMNTLLLRHAFKYQLHRLTALLSTCIYPDISDRYPMTEKDLFAGIPPISNIGYAYSKRCLALQIDAYNKEYGAKYNYIIPSNLYGPYDVMSGDKQHFVAALLTKIESAKCNGKKVIKLFGSGKPLRQFTYVRDLAAVIKYVVDNDIIESFNVATPEICSVDEIARIALRACNAEDMEIIYEEGPDGQFRKDVSSDKMLSIIPNFKFTSLYDGIKQTWEMLHK